MTSNKEKKVSKNAMTRTNVRGIGVIWRDSINWRNEFLHDRADKPYIRRGDGRISPDIQSRPKISNSAYGLVGYFRLDWISGDIRPSPRRIYGLSARSCKNSFLQLKEFLHVIPMPRTSVLIIAFLLFIWRHNCELTAVLRGDVWQMPDIRWCLL